MALSVTVIVPGWLPVAVGVNVTLMEQLAPAATEAPQVLVSAYCALAAMLVMFSAAVPELVSVMVCAALVVPTILIAEGQAGRREAHARTSAPTAPVLVRRQDIDRGDGGAKGRLVVLGRGAAQHFVGGVGVLELAVPSLPASSLVKPVLSELTVTVLLSLMYRDPTNRSPDCVGVMLPEVGEVVAAVKAVPICPSRGLEVAAPL